MKTILIGTAKGLIIYTLENQKFDFSALHFKGYSISLLFEDPRNGRWWVGVSHKHWGEKLHFSDNRGESWESVPTPDFNEITIDNESPVKLRQLWTMADGGSTFPDRLWLGVEPAALFKSEDGGQSFQLVKSLWNDPSRKDPMQWFGAGSSKPFLHAIAVNPESHEHLYVGISSAGVFESKDSGDSWKPRNEGLKATYLPNQQVEVGHDPHCIRIHPLNPDIIWQQNHCGIFYSDDGGKKWKDVTGADGLPDYGFALAIDTRDPAIAWVIPVESDQQRVAPDLQLQVYKTKDFGKTWERKDEGLPKQNTFDIVLRQAFANAEDLMVFGTTNGNVYASLDSGEHWQLICSHLTKVNVIQVSGL